MARPSSSVDICNLSLDYLKQQPINSITTPVTNSELIFARWYDIERQAALRAHTWKFAIKRTPLVVNPLTPPPFGYQYAFDLPNDYIRKVTIGNDYDGDLKQRLEIEGGQVLADGGDDSNYSLQTQPPSPAIQSWNLLMNYVAGNEVVYSGTVYICVLANAGEQPDINPGFWQEVSTPNTALTTAPTLYLRYIYDCVNVSAMDALFIKFFALGMAIDLSPKFSVAATAVDRLMKVYETVDCEARSVNGQDNPPKRIQQSKRLMRRRGYQYSVFAGPNTVFGD